MSPDVTIFPRGNTTAGDPPSHVQPASYRPSVRLSHTANIWNIVYEVRSYSKTPASIRLLPISPISHGRPESLGCSSFPPILSTQRNPNDPPFLHAQHLRHQTIRNASHVADPPHGRCASRLPDTVAQAKATTPEHLDTRNPREP